MTGTVSFTREQLFDITVLSPETLQNTAIRITPEGTVFFFSGLSGNFMPEDSPVFRFYRILCLAADPSAFTETEEGFIRNDSAGTLSIFPEEDTLVFLSEGLRVSVTPSPAS